MTRPRTASQRRWLPAFVLVLLLAATLARGADSSTLVLVGTHGSSPPGAPAGPPGAWGGPPGGAGASAPPADIGKQGIYAMRLDLQSGELSAPEFSLELERSTWLVSHPALPVVYSVAAGSSAEADSDLYSLQVNRTSGHADVISKVASGGRDATALEVDVRSGTLFAAHYGSGSVTTVPILSNGALGPVASSQAETGSGPHPRQKSAHAHDVALAPGGRAALVTDLGADRIFIYRFDPATRRLLPGKPAEEQLPAGSGPRHLAFLPNGKYVLVNTELTAELRSYRWDRAAQKLSLVQTIEAFPRGGAGDPSGGELVVSKDGRHAYISLRGNQDSIVVYAVDGQRGMLTEIERIPAQGKTPWSFGIDPTGRWMLITNEASNSVSVLKVNPSTGLLSVTGISVTVPKPVTVTFPVR